MINSTSNNIHLIEEQLRKLVFLHHPRVKLVHQKWKLSLECHLQLFKTLLWQTRITCKLQVRVIWFVVLTNESSWCYASGDLQIHRKWMCAWRPHERQGIKYNLISNESVRSFDSLTPSACNRVKERNTFSHSTVGIKVQVSWVLSHTCRRGHICLFALNIRFLFSRIFPPFLLSSLLHVEWWIWSLNCSWNWN